MGNKFSISFDVKRFLFFPFSIVMQIYAHLFCPSLSNYILIAFIDKTTNYKIQIDKFYNFTNHDAFS